MKEKICYCIKCKRKTVHRVIEKETLCDDLGLFRPIMAIFTLGISESTVKYKCECRRCGYINIVNK